LKSSRLQRTTKITENNEAFRIRPPEEDLFYTYFRQYEEDEAASQWLTAAQIMGLLCLKTYLMMSSGGNVRLGILLRKEGFPVLRRKNKCLYQVMRMSDDQVDREKNRATGILKNSRLRRGVRVRVVRVVSI
jgi:hypothetical protein